MSTFWTFCLCGARRDTSSPCPGNDQSREPPLACLRSATTTFTWTSTKRSLAEEGYGHLPEHKQKAYRANTPSLRLGRDGKTAILRDLNSLNGTFVNNTRVHNSTCKLKSNDRIRFGCDVVSYLFQFRNDMQEYSPNRERRAPNARHRTEPRGLASETSMAKA